MSFIFILLIVINICSTEDNKSCSLTKFIDSISKSNEWKSRQKSEYKKLTEALKSKSGEIIDCEKLLKSAKIITDNKAFDIDEFFVTEDQLNQESIITNETKNGADKQLLVKSVGRKENLKNEEISRNKENNEEKKVLEKESNIEKVNKDDRMKDKNKNGKENKEKANLNNDNENIEDSNDYVVLEDKNRIANTDNEDVGNKNTVSAMKDEEEVQANKKINEGEEMKLEDVTKKDSQRKKENKIEKLNIEKDEKDVEKKKTFENIDRKKKEEEMKLEDVMKDESQTNEEVKREEQYEEKAEEDVDQKESKGEQPDVSKIMTSEVHEEEIGISRDSHLLEPQINDGYKEDSSEITGCCQGIKEMQYRIEDLELQLSQMKLKFREFTERFDGIREMLLNQTLLDLLNKTQYYSVEANAACQSGGNLCNSSAKTNYSQVCRNEEDNTLVNITLGESVKSILCKNNSIVILNRVSNLTSFNRSWEEYKLGFGDLYENFWMGLEYIHYLTSMATFQLIVSITDWDNKTHSAFYDKFFVNDESDGYRVNIAGFSGDEIMGNSLSRHSGHRFSTFDKDNDFIENYYNGSCSKRFQGGWWYFSCYRCNPTGVYYDFNDLNKNKLDGITWKTFQPANYSLKYLSMSIKHVIL